MKVQNSFPCTQHFPFFFAICNPDEILKAETQVNPKLGLR